jgi:tRNA-2-methylthio-N6-dimethylallyladenosine synthase
MALIDLPVVDPHQPAVSTVSDTPVTSTGGRVYVETYGCQMNVSDSEIVLGVLHQSGYQRAESIEDADVVLLNTCAIRDNAEKKIHERLRHLNFFKNKRENMVIGVLGCMAERLRADLLEKEVHRAEARVSL